MTEAQLSGLNVTPPGHFAGTFSLGIDVTTTDGADTETTSDSFDVTVTAVADSVNLTANDVSGSEDTAIALDLATSLQDTDGSESITSIVVTGVPNGAVLSAGIDNGDGTWSLTQGQLSGLTVTPPEHFSGTIGLGIDITTTDGADTETTSDTFDVNVTAVADTVNLTANDVSGSEDSAIALDLATSLQDADGSESITSVVVTGIPSGATLSAGIDNGDGTWTLTPGELGGLTVTPPSHFAGTISLGIDVTTTDGADTETTSDTFDVTVTAVADAVNLTANDVSGSEDSAIALDLATSLQDTDGSESITSVVVTGIPSGATLSAGTDNGDGTWTLTPAELGGLTVTPPSHFAGTISLGIDVTTTDGADTETTSDTFDVNVTAVADAVDLTANDVSGSEDTAIALDLATSLQDTDGSESITSVVVTGVPSGATLSAGTDNGDGTWTLTPGELGALTVTPPTHFAGTISLGIDVTTTDGADTETTSDTFDVTVTAVADAVDLTANEVSGSEDSAIALDLATSLQDTDGSETITSVVVTGIPSGATLSAGTDNGDGTWTLTPAQLSGLTVTPPANFSGAIAMGIDVTTDDGGDTQVTSDTFQVNVTGVADVATITANDVTGDEDSAIALDLGASLTDSSESITSVILTGVPSGSVLSGGTDNGDGTWTLTAAQLSGLTVTPPANFSGAIAMGIDVTTDDGGDTQVTSDTFQVNVTGVADVATITANDVTGDEDSAIALDLGASLTDSSESITSVVLTGVPSGSVLSSGTDNGDGTWTLTAAQLSGLTVTPPANFSGAIVMGIDVTTDDGGDTQVTSDTFQVNVTGVADVATITANDVTGDEDSAIALDLGASLNRFERDDLERRSDRRAERVDPLKRNRQRRWHLDLDGRTALRLDRHTARELLRRHRHGHRRHHRRRWRPPGHERHLPGQRHRRRRCRGRHGQQCRRQRRLGHRPRPRGECHRLQRDHPLGGSLRRPERNGALGGYRQRRRHLVLDPGAALRADPHAPGALPRNALPEPRRYDRRCGRHRGDDRSLQRDRRIGHRCCRGHRQ